MDIVIVAQYIMDITTNESLNSRFVYIANMLKDNHNVEIITTDFIHARKEHVTPIDNFHDIKITMLHEPGYKRNISLNRFYSHNILSKNISDYLNKRKKPDVVYCAIPSIDVAFETAKYAKDNNVRFIIDIQDLWPEAFKMVFNIPIISDLIFFPLQFKAEKVYKAADSIVAVSETYIKRAMKVNTIANNEVVYLGTNKDTFDNNMNPVIEGNKLHVVYVGSLEKSYDLPTVIRGLSNVDNVKLVVIGDGSLKEEFMNMANEYQIDCEFTGYLSYSEMISKMSECHIAVNPIKKGSAGSVINKVGDYAMAGLPVVNTQECVEYRNLLDAYNAGINCQCENAEELRDAVIYLQQNESVRFSMNKGSRLLGEERFNRKETYLKILSTIENK